MSTGRPITVAVNTLSVTRANEGIRTVLRCLLPALSRVAPEIHQVLVCSRANREMFDPAADVIEVPVNHGRVVSRIIADQLRVPLIIKGRADVLITPSSVGTLLSPLPQVVLVPHHLALPSCQALAGPGTLDLAHRLYLGPILRWSLRRADAVLGISRFVADGLVRELHIEKSKVAAMPLGVEAPPLGGGAAEREPLVLFVGTLYEYKDAMVAVEAFARALPTLPVGATLVIVGRDPDDRQIPALQAAAQRLGLGDYVQVMGSVSEDDLTALYERAGAFLMPSRCEGFGLPVLEAMSHGTPVIAADATALTEVTVDAGMLVRPGDIGAFGAALTTVFNDPAHRADLVARGHQRAAGMNWNATAECLHRAIQAVAP